MTSGRDRTPSRRRSRARQPLVSGGRVGQVEPVERVQRTVATGIAVIDPDPCESRAVTLWIDDVPHSSIHLGDPLVLSFEYVRQIGDVIDITFPAGAPIDAAHLGGGALTIPRYVLATRPGSRQRVAEIDGPLVDLVRERLPLPASSRIRLSIIDGRALVGRLPPQSLDLVVVDAFDNGRMPHSLTTVEFMHEVARRLRPTGLMIMNLADGGPLAFARSLVASAQPVFAQLAVAAEPSVWRGRRFGNLLLLASATPLPVADLRRRLSGGAFPARLVSGPDLAALLTGAAIRTDGRPSPTPAAPASLFASLSRSASA